VADELDALTVAELDDLAEANDVDGYPWSGNKPQKIAALEAAGLGTSTPQSAPTVTFALNDAYFADAEPEDVCASFMAGPDAVELAAGDTFATDDPQIAAGLRYLEFLQEVGA
jgi:hypothetical protein